MNSKKSSVYLFVVGLVITGLDFPINTGLDYGFQFGINEGVTKGINTYFLEALIGEQFRIDIFFNPLGYFLMFLGLIFINGYGKCIRNARIFTVAGCVVNIVRLLLPFVLSQYELLQPLILLVAAEIFCMAVIMYSFMVACKKQVDNYLYMEVGKDLIFGMEIYAFAEAASYIILPFAALYIYFARGAYVLVRILSCLAILYYVFKVLRYTKRIPLFEENNKKEVKE